MMTSAMEVVLTGDPAMVKLDIMLAHLAMVETSVR